MIVQVRFILKDGKRLLIDNGVSTTEISGFMVSTQEAYRGYLLNVARSYADDTRLSTSRA